MQAAGGAPSPPAPRDRRRHADRPHRHAATRRRTSARWAGHRRTRPRPTRATTGVPDERPVRAPAR